MNDIFNQLIDVQKARVYRMFSVSAIARCHDKLVSPSIDFLTQEIAALADNALTDIECDRVLNRPVQGFVNDTLRDQNENENELTQEEWYESVRENL
ncbi:MAG: hypothetical protein KGI58_04020 [Patescibacteria group bacterium]|nr:hypothetical protein [Patescibacteria group bacterium]